LHLSYILAGTIGAMKLLHGIYLYGDQVYHFYIKVLKLRFADIDSHSLNISVDHVKKLLTKKTKAIVIVDYGGLPCDLVHYNNWRMNTRFL